MIVSILIFLLLISVLVIVHEGGHFLIARANGIRVDEFTVGVGPALFKKQKGETVFAVRALPFGGACIFDGMYDDDGESYAYEEGAVCSTLFECHQKGAGFTVTVHPVQGTYEGMPESRNYRFEIRCPAKPRKVSLNGAPVKDWSWEDSTLKVSAGRTGIRDKAELTIQL